MTSVLLHIYHDASLKRPGSGSCLVSFCIAWSAVNHLLLSLPDLLVGDTRSWVWSRQRHGGGDKRQNILHSILLLWLFDSCAATKRTLAAHQELRILFADKMAESFDLYTHTHTQQATGKQGCQALQWRRNGGSVCVCMLSRAPNCSDEYEAVVIGGKSPMKSPYINLWKESSCL